MHDTSNHKLQKEQRDDNEVLTKAVRTNVSQLKKTVYDCTTVIEAVNKGTGGI